MRIQYSFIQRKIVIGFVKYKMYLSPETNSYSLLHPFSKVCLFLWQSWYTEWPRSPWRLKMSWCLSSATSMLTRQWWSCESYYMTEISCYVIMMVADVLELYQQTCHINDIMQHRCFITMITGIKETMSVNCQFAVNNAVLSGKMDMPLII